MKQTRCVIVSAAPLDECMKKQIRPQDFIIACDAGYKSVRNILKAEPDVILGDFDSAPEPKEKGALVLPRVKDDTDTHYAAKLAVEKGFSKILMLGALGGKRMEHTIANLSTGLWLAKQGVDVMLQDANSRVQFLLPGGSLYLPHAEDEFFSIFPMEGKAEGVSESGAKYCLEDAVLTADYPLGVSNETLPGGAQISVKQGSLVVIRTKKD